MYNRDPAMADIPEPFMRHYHERLARWDALRAPVREEKKKSPYHAQKTARHGDMLFIILVMLLCMGGD